MMYRHDALNDFENAQEVAILVFGTIAIVNTWNKISVKTLLFGQQQNGKVC